MSDWLNKLNPASQIRGLGGAGGFTLIEMAVAVFLIALLLGSILVPLTTQVEQRQVSDTQKTMEEIKEALLGFAVAKSRLPCPDKTDAAGDGTANDGQEDITVATGACVAFVGNLPWVTLNVAQGDPWGNRFRYRVTRDFTFTPLTTGTCATMDDHLGLCDSGDITVNTRNLTTKVTQPLASNVVAVIISHGENRYGATSTGGIAQAAVPAGNVDEGNNATTPGTAFISRVKTGTNAVCSDIPPVPPIQPLCEFDDVVTWLSAFTLFNRLVAAGKLP